MTGASDGAKLRGDQRAAAAADERGRAVKLHGIMLAKNEADVIGDALRAAARPAHARPGVPRDGEASR